MAVVQDKTGQDKTGQDKATLPLIEEEAAIETSTVVTGRVRFHSKVRTIDQTVKAELWGEEVEVTRVPCDRVIEAAPNARQDGDVMIIPVVEEILIVEKRLVLKEELHIRKKTVSKPVEMPVSLRKLDVVVERDGAGEQPISSSRRMEP